MGLPRVDGLGQWYNLCAAIFSGGPTDAFDSMNDSDRQWMERALELAERGRGYVEPNPLVGAVVVLFIYHALVRRRV